MTQSPYKRISRVLRRHSALIVATVALVVALVGVPGVTAGGLLVTSKNVKNNSITSADIKKATLKTSDLGTNAVRSADIQSGAVEGSDIGNGEVEPQDVTMPDPQQVQASDTASADFGTGFALLDSVGTYTKQDATAILEVTWTGTGKAPSSSCVFQLRVDGQPAQGGAGQAFVVGGSTASVSASALFGALPIGPHTIEVWAKALTPPPDGDACVIGPAEAGIPQNFVFTEQVV